MRRTHFRRASILLGICASFATGPEVRAQYPSHVGVIAPILSPSGSVSSIVAPRAPFLPLSRAAAVEGELASRSMLTPPVSHRDRCSSLLKPIIGGLAIGFGAFAATYLIGAASAGAGGGSPPPSVRRTALIVGGSVGTILIVGGIVDCKRHPPPPDSALLDEPN